MFNNKDEDQSYFVTSKEMSDACSLNFWLGWTAGVMSLAIFTMFMLIPEKIRDTVGLWLLGNG